MLAPGRCSSWRNNDCSTGNSGTEPYIVAHNILIAHATIVKLYGEKYKPYQKGKIGMVYATQDVECADHLIPPPVFHRLISNDTFTLEVTDLLLQFFVLHCYGYRILCLPSFSLRGVERLLSLDGSDVFVECHVVSLYPYSSIF